MIQHIALFTWKPGFAGSPRMQEWSERLTGLPEVVPALRSITIGHDIAHGDRSWDTAVITVVDDLDGLDEYTRCPAHQAATEVSAPHIERLAQVDFETSD